MSRRRVAIVGARIHGRRDLVEGLVAALPPDAVVVSGGAAGVDSWAETAARDRGLAVSSYPPDYDAHGARAPLVRNGAIVADATEVHAFPWWGARGTLDTIANATIAGAEDATACGIVFAQSNGPWSNLFCVTSKAGRVTYKLDRWD